MSGIRYLTELGSHMTLGERAAIEGVLHRVSPTLAIEIGTHEGASLRQIAAHAREVHTFDLVEPSRQLPANTRFHAGDSHVLLARVLEGLASEGRNVDFVLVDGDHSGEGARSDLEDLLHSPALGRSVILLHDTANEEVRAGLDEVGFESWPKVNWVDLDFFPGFLFRDRDQAGEIWGGLGIILVDAPAALDRPLRNETVFPAAQVLGEFRDRRTARERRGVRALAHRAVSRLARSI